MQANQKITTFLSQYDEPVFTNALKLREILLANLPGVTEQIDVPAKMIAYCYGQKYVDMICMLIPSRKGLKLSFYNGIDLPDPDHLLEGNAKLTRYVEIRSCEQICSHALKQIIEKAMLAYKELIK